MVWAWHRLFLALFLWIQLPPVISKSKLTHKHTLPHYGWSTERKHDLYMDVRYVNILIDGQLKNTDWSLLEAESCQLWGMRGHVLLGKWSGVWLSGRKEVLINVEKAGTQQPQACLLPHIHTHAPIQTAQACSCCGSLLYRRAGVHLHEKSWLRF